MAWLRSTWTGFLLTGMFTALVPACGGGDTSSTKGGGGTAGNGGTAGQGASNSQAGSTGQGGTGGDGTGGGGGPIGDCAPGMAPYDGPLCGPPSAPCTVQINELLPSPPSFRNDAPAIAVDDICSPAAIYSIAEGSYQGYFARRHGEDLWQEEQTPFEIATGGLVFDGGSPVTLVNDGAYGASLWERGAAGWESVAQVPGEITHWARSFAKSGPAHYRMGAVTSGYQLVLGTFENGSWSVDDVGSSSTPVALGLSPAGAPHIAYWGGGGGAWILDWIAPPGSAEAAVPTSTGTLEYAPQLQSIVVTAPNGANLDGVPHVFVAKPLPGGVGNSLVLATRESGSWVETTIDTETPGSYAFCNNEPSAPGDICNYDLHTMLPLYVVGVPSGHVRALYADHHRVGSLIGMCEASSGPPICYWQTQSDTSTAEIRVGWIEPNGQPATAPVLTGVFAWSATAVVDTVGAIHLLTYDAPPLVQGTSIHYFRIGP